MEIKIEDVRRYFDTAAPRWDSRRAVQDDILWDILDKAGIVPGCHILDVACGTGVLFPYYLERRPAGVTGVDLSPEMIRLATEKYRDMRIELLTGDVEQLKLGTYDCIVILNALPHFADPRRLLAVLSGCLGPGGRLTVAHDQARHVIDSHHRRAAGAVSNGLPPAEKTAEWMGQYLAVDTVIDGEDRYIVSGILRKTDIDLQYKTIPK
jgi:demethylmenaquinone methyltransferase/2-methoxy-6-polyprenyl-1,4-benzoquinol methylase